MFEPHEGTKLAMAELVQREEQDEGEDVELGDTTSGVDLEGIWDIP